MTDDLTPKPAEAPVSGPVSHLPPAELRPAAERLFGPRLPLAVQYAELLATDGVVRGLIGPRETPRIWDRHLLNCAALAELIGPDATVVDVGSGAGLPGLVLAVARPDLRMTLLEPMARRVAFLSEAVERLGLAGVDVCHGRAEERVGSLPAAQVVTARAVAPLDRLAGWCLPLVGVGGKLLAIKGATAADEVATHEAAVRRCGGGTPTVVRCGVGIIEPPTTVIEVERERRLEAGRRRSSGKRGGARGSRRRGRGAV